MITYNHEDFISKAIEGVLFQKTGFPVELVIGEDCSTDRTGQICEEYARKYPNIIRLLPSIQNLGAAHNGRRTLGECNGKYVAFCEGDDYWTDPSKLQKQVDFLEAHPDYSICFHDVNILENGKIVPDYITRNVPADTDILELVKGNYMHTVSVVYKNGLFDNLPDNFSDVSAGDYFIHMLNARHGKIRKMGEIMAVYRIHDGNMHFHKSQAQKNSEWLMQIGSMIPSFQGEVRERLIKSFIDHVEYELLDNKDIAVVRQVEMIRMLSNYCPAYIISLIKEHVKNKAGKNDLFHKIWGSLYTLIDRIKCKIRHSVRSLIPAK